MLEKYLFKHTFAYFSVSTSTNTASTAITATTDKVGTITVSGGENLQISLTATDMAEDSQKSYYSTISGGKNHEDSPTQHDLAKLELSGSASNTKYTCTGNVKIKLEAQTPVDGGQDPATLPEFVAGDAILHLTGAKNLDGSEGTSEDIDLKDIKDESNEKEITDVSFNLTDTDTTKKLTGYLEVKNTSADQNYLANKAFKVTVTLENISCSIDKAAEE